MEDSIIKILLVDDDESARNRLTAFFEENYFCVSGCGSAEEAISLFENESFDVAIIDLRLPVLNGEALIIKLNEKYPDVKFLIYTGMTRYKVSKNIREAGVKKEHVFLKPLEDLSVFIQTVNTLFY